MKTCPKCKSNMIIDIVYRLSSEVLSGDANKNKLVSGIIEPDGPEYKCKSCGNEFGGLNQFLNNECINDDL